MRIKDFLTIDTIDLFAEAKNKNEVISKACDLMFKSGVIENKELFQKAVLDRERECTTGIGNSLAIPHARGTFVKKAQLAAMVFKNGVDYESLDNNPIKILFLIAAPETKESANLHLDVLARLSKMLIDNSFLNNLVNCNNTAEFLNLINKKEEEILKNENQNELVIKNAKQKFIIAITSCPTGIAHTYMAQEALETAAKELNVQIKVETQGSGGVKNTITDEDIKNAQGIIIAADTNVDLERFDNLKMIRTSVTSGIKRPKELIEQMIKGEASIYQNDYKQTKNKNINTEKLSFGQSVYKNIMSGISHMLPFVIAGGILIALGFIIDTFYGENAVGSNFGSYSNLAWFFNTIGGTAFSFLYAILGGFIAYSIAGRPALAVGIISGALARSQAFQIVQSGSDAGFLGAMIAGFASGFLILLLQKSFTWVPKSIEGLKPMLIYPLLGTILMGIIMYFVINTPLGYLNFYIKLGLEKIIGKETEISTIFKVGIGILLGGMMAVDMGGPINKVAYTIGVSSIQPDGINQPWIMASVMIGGMMPPIIIALAADLFPQKFTSKERKDSKVNYLMGISFITEGAIPYAAKDPIRVILSSIIASAIAGGMTAGLNVSLLAPHGGLFVIAVATNWYFFILAFVISAFIGAFILGSLKIKSLDNHLKKWKGIPIGNGINMKRFLKIKYKK